MIFSTYSKPAEPDFDENNRTDIFKLNRYETVFLLGYEFCCTVMTIFLNSYLLLIILFKVRGLDHILLNFSIVIETLLNVFERQVFQCFCFYPNLGQIKQCSIHSLTIFIKIFKVKLEGRPQTVPMITAAFFGLFHGFGCNLIMTVSLAQRSWWGSLDWCGAAANIHKYIIYSIIYCQVVVSLEVQPHRISI